MINKILNGLILLIWILLGSYFATASYALIDLEKQKLEAEMLPADSIPKQVGHVTFKNKKSAEIYSEEQSIKSNFKFVKNIPELVLFLIAASSFGLIGGCINIIKEIALDDVELSKSRVISIPLLGLFSGIIILGLSSLLPTFLVVGDTVIRPVTLIFLSLFAGIFSKQFYSWINERFGDIFKAKDS
jgi:hypothetical protein